MKRMISAADGLTSRERVKIAKTTNNQRELLRLAHDKSKAVRLEVAQRIDPQYLDILVDDPYYKIRAYVAERTNDETLLAKLADDEDEEWIVRRTVAERTNDEATLAKLADDEDEDVRAAVAKHATDENVLAKLAEDEDVYVRAAVAKRTTDENILAKLAGDEDDHVRYAVAARTTDEDLLAKLSDDQDSWVRYVVNGRLSRPAAQPKPKKSRPATPPKNDWSVKLYELENYAQIETEIDAVIHQIIDKVAASDPLAREFSYETTANSYDEDGEFVISATDSTGETKEFAIDLQKFLAAITSSQKKSDCVKKGVAMIKRLVG